MENEIQKIIDEVASEMCDDYCRHAYAVKNKKMDDEEYTIWLEEHCSNCPLNRIC